MKTKGTSGLMVTGLAGALLLAGNVNASGLQGKFHLDHSVRWAQSVLEPGDYTIEVTSTAQPAIVVVDSESGKKVMFMVRSIGDSRRPTTSLVLSQTSQDWEVRALNMPELGVTLMFGEAERKDGEKPTSAAAVTVVKGR